MLHCGSASPSPMLPSHGLPKGCDLPAMKQGLPHDLLEGHVSWADQPVGVQLPERLKIRHSSPRFLNTLAGEAGEG